MKITREFFKGDLFLPAMNPSITDNSEVNSLQNFINTYSEKCLIECFGYTLFELVKEANAIIEANKLVDIQTNPNDIQAVDQKWIDLIQGEVVTLENGQKKRWKGLSYKSLSTLEENDLSFITNYVYYFYERSEYVGKSTTGDVKLQAEGSKPFNAGYKTSIAWNNFVDEVVGVSNSNTGNVQTSDFGQYINWYSGNTEFSLYQYIIYKNNLDKSTYEHFAPKLFKKINEFGI